MKSNILKSLIVKQLSVGKYIEFGALASTGYLLIKDEFGTERKLMVKAPFDIG